ncbi:hypothetical protein [Nocardioides caldifontis]|uniref:hypothetical protein n=1 Tax=Nocardioides caldifontis TaxID=2588938 RepID=UPI0011DFEE9C|nr:hypothetical protein [Nocardioides caldifontis]
MRRGARPLAVLACATLLAVQGCQETVAPVKDQPSASPSPTEDVALPDAPTVLLQVPEDGDEIEQVGTAEVDVNHESVNGGELAVVPGWEDEPALDFPEFTTAKRYPQAVVLVDNIHEDDQLSPGTRSFSWGADFLLDERTTGGADDGDNLVQRGLASQPVYFKVEVDNRHAACTVGGTKGTVYARNYLDLVPGRWYRVLCTREGDSVSAVVTEISSSGGGRPTVTTRVGNIGDVTFKESTIPFVVGGKVGSDHRLVEDSEVFNGLVMNPLFDIADD